MSHNNGYTNKEMLQLIAEDIQNLHKRIDYLHEKINKSPSRQEIIGWLVAISSTAALLNTLMWFKIDYMKAQVNLGQILQGGLAALVGWLFKTVNDLQQEVATLKAQVAAYQDSISGFNQNLVIIEEVIREILFKVGG